MHPIHLAECVAAAFAFSAASCSSPPSDDPAGVGHPSASPPTRLARDAPDRPEIATTNEDDALASVSMVARGIRGLALLDRDGLTIATAETEFPVVDIEYDAAAGHWIVAEYEDDSANQLSSWALRKSGSNVQLARAAARATEGFCHVFGTQLGLLVIQHDGLQSRWALVSSDLQTTAWQARAPVPSSVFAPDAESMRRMGIVQVDAPAGPSTTLSQWEVSATSLVLAQDAPLGRAWDTLDPIKACAQGATGLVFARVQDDDLRVELRPASPTSSVSVATLHLAAAASVLDVVCDEQRGGAYALLSGAANGRVVRIAPGGALSAVPIALPSLLDRGAWPSRRLAWDSSRLIVGGDDFVASLDLGEDGAVTSWQRSSLRWPVTTTRLPAKILFGGLDGKRR